MLNFQNNQNRKIQNDQAAGLRRIMATPRPRVVSILSTAPSRDQARLMANLATPIVAHGNDVLILHASHESSESIYEINKLPALLDVINSESLLQSAIKNSGNGFSVAKLMPAHQVGKPLDSFLGEQLNAIFIGLAPVSYTHLDVYKRQANTCAGMPLRVSWLSSSTS